MTVPWQVVYLAVALTTAAGLIGMYQTLLGGWRRHEAWRERIERNQAMEAQLVRHEALHQASRAEHAEQMIAQLRAELDDLKAKRADLRAELDALKGEIPQQPTWYAEAMEEDGSPPTAP